MNKTGPSLESLLHRLSEIPPEFLEEPMIAGKQGRISVSALVHDMLNKYNKNVDIKVLLQFQGADVKSDRNKLALAMIMVWLFVDEWFLSGELAQSDILNVFIDTMNELAQATPAQKFVSDSDRREELVRVVLAKFEYRPSGETVSQATDRLAALSSTQRKRLLEESRAAEQRARAIREALVKKAAQESADKWTRE